MHLQADEACGMGLVDFSVGEVFHGVAVNPGLDTIAFGDDSYSIPSLIVKVMVTVLYFFIRRKPAGPQRLAIDKACRRGSLAVISLQLHLWSVDAAGSQVVTLAFGEGPHPRADLYARIRHAVHHDLHLEFEIPEFLLCAQERIAAARGGATYDGPVCLSGYGLAQYRPS